MPTTVLISFQAKPTKRDALIEFLSDLQPRAIEAGCHSIAVHRVQDSNNAVVEVEYWDNRTDHQNFVAAAMEVGTFAPLDDLLDGPFEVHYLDPAKKTDA